MVIENLKNLKPFFISIVVSAVIWIIFGFLMSKSPVAFFNKIAILVPIILFISSIILQFISYLRFLKKIRFDKKTNKIHTTSVFEFIKKDLTPKQIDKIELIKSIGFKNNTDGFRNQNLAIRLKGKIQPLIFEIENVENLKHAETLIAEITNANKA